MLAAGIELDGASDHGVSEALYLRDPDENGVELYWDRPREQWPRTPGGELAHVHPRPGLGRAPENLTALDSCFISAILSMFLNTFLTVF